MKYKVELNYLENRINSLKKFTTFQEKNALFIDDHISILDVVKELTDIIPINELEAEIFLLKLREISVSDIIEVVVICPECDAPNPAEIKIPDIINIQPTYFKEEIIPCGIFNNINEILSDDVAESLSLKDYNKLEALILDQNDNIFKDSITKCRKCQAEISVIFDPRDIFTKSTAGGIYQEYIDISTYTNNGKLDIDSLYPYEREMFISLISEKLKKE